MVGTVVTLSSITYLCLNNGFSGCDDGGDKKPTIGLFWGEFKLL
jgi:hypothetical protein